MTPSTRYIVGVTGGIGSGKSAVTERFAALGAHVVDTDLIAHQLTGPGGAAIAAIIEAFDEGVISADGALDRKAMRDLVYADIHARRRLEAILHPLIRGESERACRAAPAPYVILAVPLLIESGTFRERCDRICVVDAPVEMQISRVKARNNLDEAQIRSILAAQASREERLACADDVIDNSGSLAALDEQVERLHHQYMRLACYSNLPAE
jgi:dephospho-CoA kinase